MPQVGLMYVKFENNRSNVMTGFGGQYWYISRLLQVVLRKNRWMMILLTEIEIRGDQATTGRR